MKPITCTLVGSVSHSNEVTRKVARTSSLVSSGQYSLPTHSACFLDKCSKSPPYTLHHDLGTGRRNPRRSTRTNTSKQGSVMTSTEMGAADLTSLTMPALADGPTFFELGMKYASGRSGPADLVVAHKWFNVAVAHGCRTAAARRPTFEASSHERCPLRRSRRHSARHACTSPGTDLRPGRVQTDNRCANLLPC